MRTTIALSIFIITLLPFAAALSATPDGGFSPGQVNVTLTAAPGNTILYTLDGTNPRNGTAPNGTIAVTQRPSAPSTLATTPESAIFAFTPPNSTIKGTVLRAVEIAPNGTVVQEIARTYFIGMDASAFTVPVFSIVADPAYFEEYTIGMLIKGKTYYDDLAANGGNPNNPFRPANWNNDSLRWPARYEIYDDGTRQLADAMVFYPSGRWSGALAKKSFKIKYDKAVGPKDTSYPFFGAESEAKYTKIRLRQGSQDWDSGIQMRDCAIGEIAQDMNVEIEHCRQVIVFLNGEYWGVYNLHEDFDDKQLAQQYGINKDDVVVLEQDGIVDEGEEEDNQEYFALRDWLQTHSLADQADYDYFASKVNVESLIDYYTVHAYFNNVDFPNDHRFWRNKNPASQVPGTPYDGRWYFHPKDRDQTMGMYGTSYTTNTIQMMLNKSSSDWGTLFLREAMENEGFKQQFIQRNLALLDADLDPATIAQIIDGIADEKRPELAREIARWKKPSNLGWWNLQVNETKTWVVQREVAYRGFLLALNMTNTTGNTTTNETNSTGACYESVLELPVTCTGGTITQDTSIGTCRTIVCGAKQVKACDKSDGHFVMYNQVRADQIEVCFGDPEWGGLCMTDWGYMRSTEAFPLCSGEAFCGNGIVEEGEECDGSAPEHYLCTAACTLEYVPYCGDGTVNQPSEECDDGNLIDDDECTNACTLPEEETSLVVTLHGTPSIIQLALDLLATIPGLGIET